MPVPEFRPRGPFKNTHLQSVLSSSGLRRWIFRKRHRDVETASREYILDCGDGVRLQGFYAEHAGATASRGLVVLMHGWEGSAQSSYILNVAWKLGQSGYDVFRLNFRDHGETHHLNEDVFHSCRIEEVVGAVAEVARLFPQRPLSIVGFSLGGNFALRVALRAVPRSIPLTRVVAICPAIRPHNILDAIEQAPWFYHTYFMLKWRGSLKRKQELFPQHHRFDNEFLKRDMRGMTAGLIERQTEFSSLDDYFSGYSIHGNNLATLNVPASILAAVDDPIIPISDFRALQLPDCVKLDITEHGGHCGYIRDWSLESWAEDYLLEQLSAPVAQDRSAA